MSCDHIGHVGVEDHHIQPKFRCIYCGSWGYRSRWDDEDKQEYEDCECDGTFEEHWKNCD